MNAEEQRLREVIKTAKRSNELAIKRREIINKCKDSISQKFYEKMELIKCRENLDKDYTNEMVRNDTKKLIEHTQKQLDKLKINGKFYEKKEEKVEDDVWKMNCLKLYKYKLKGSKCPCKKCKEEENPLQKTREKSWKARAPLHYEAKKENLLKKVEDDVLEIIDEEDLEYTIEPCKNCGIEINLEDGENEECEYCNKDCCFECINHTDNDQYLCDKCL